MRIQPGESIYVAAEAGVQDMGGNGRGVAAADFNDHGWTDLYVGAAGAGGDGLDFRSRGDQGNINRLFLNMPGPRRTRVFRDVTEVAGVGDPRSASTIAAGVQSSIRSRWADPSVVRDKELPASTSKMSPA